MAERDLSTTREAEFHPVATANLALLSVNSGVPLEPAMWEAIILLEQGIAVLDALAADVESEEHQITKANAARFILQSSRAIFEAVHASMETPREAA